jgi:methylmalonyl-CoA carboxyltransferase 12S subunit
MRSHVTEIETQETKMSEPVPDDLRATLQDILAQLAHLSERVSGMEKLVSPAGAELAPTVKAEAVEATVAEVAPSNSSVAAEAGISEEELLAISAALAAWLGVQPHIRQIRLIRSSAWAQQGRVIIQASHGLHH